MMPTKYRKNFPEKLVKHMSQGLSFDAFGGVVKASGATLEKWVERYPKFKEAKREGEHALKCTLEKLGLAISSGKLPSSKPAAWIFTMKNLAGWRDTPAEIIPETRIHLSYNLPPKSGDKDD